MHLHKLADEYVQPITAISSFAPRYCRYTFAATALAALSMYTGPTVALSGSGPQNQHIGISCRKYIKEIYKKYGEHEAIYYYSRDGQVLVKCLQISKPTIKFIPLKLLDPPRTLPAQKWSSPACAEWHDAEYTCTRDRFKAIINCHKSGAIDNSFPRTVVCNRSFEPKILEAFCADLKTELIYYYSDGTSARFTGDEASWRHEYKIRERKWVTTLIDGSNSLPIKRNPALRAEESDNICLRGFSSKSSTSGYSGIYLTLEKS